MKISVIVPVFNTEKWIARCLESLNNQTFKDYEVIIIDDCGGDNAIHIAEEFANKDQRIRIIHHNENKGLMIARRTGYLNARGEFIMFLDSDDTLPPNSLKLLHSSISQVNADIVIGGYTYLHLSGDSKTYVPKYSHNFTSKELFIELLSGKITHNLAFGIFKRSLFNNKLISIPKQTNGEDLILFYQLVGYSSKIAFCGNSIYNYFENSASSSNSILTSEKIRQFINTQNFKISYLIDKGVNIHVILRNIVPIVSRWYHHRTAISQIGNLNPIIIDAMKPINSKRYMNLKQWLRFITHSLN